MQQDPTGGNQANLNCAGATQSLDGAPPEHFDVLVVGAGLAGIAAASHLQANLPRKSYAILEARDAVGGTWDLFRYPGIRSDSDMHTFSYRFRPWPEEKSIADGESILRYIRAAAREHAIDERIRFGHRVTRAEWSTAAARWTVCTKLHNGGETVRFSCGFLLSCAGYYDYDQGFSPTFEGAERFKGTVVHPQHWPEDLDYASQRVVVIGSGATAVTLVPSMARIAAHVTMLQRSPSYIVAQPSRDRHANRLRQLLPPIPAAAITRWKNVLRALGFYQLSRRRPELVKALLRKGLEQQLPAGYDIDTHFTPSYNPWDQRLTVVPDGDLFAAIRENRASIVTDRIETFTESGIRLESGNELEADVIVTATGLNLVAAGGIDFVIDGEPLDIAKTVAYKAIMLSDVPNFAFIIGYFNSSWTLKVDLVCEYLCRLLIHVDEHGYRECRPRSPDPSVEERPYLDFNAGYVLRATDQLPKQGTSGPWRVHQNYIRDLVTLRYKPVADDVLQFTNSDSALSTSALRVATGRY